MKDELMERIQNRALELEATLNKGEVVAQLWSEFEDELPKEIYNAVMFILAVLGQPRKGQHERRP